jgi:Raf kinase inhibitor-like YbhB/YbcL family protein
MTHQALLKITPVLALVALASCGAGNQPAEEAEGGTAVENATPTKLEVTSEAFRDGQAIPQQYSCDGTDQSPPLRWGEPPPGTKSFALVVDDPDAPGGTFRHWGVFDIPAEARSLSAGQAAGAQAVNDFGKTGYGGPCPPKGHGVHHYQFKLFALNVDRLGLDANAKVAEVENAARQRAIGQGKLIGTYERR